MKYQKAFTLIELVVTMGILVLLTGLGIPAFQRFGVVQELNQGAELVANTVREAQSLALAPRAIGGDLKYVVNFSSPRTIIIQPERATGLGGALNVVRLSNQLSFASSTWIFPVADQGRLEGGVSKSVIITHQRLPGSQKTVSGNGVTGLIEVK